METTPPGRRTTSSCASLAPPSALVRAFLPLWLAAGVLAGHAFVEAQERTLGRTAERDLWDSPAFASNPLEMTTAYIGETFVNTRGGINTNRAVAYRGYFGVLASLDLDAAMMEPGGRLVVLGELGHGHGISARNVGDFQLLSNIDADQFVQISEVFWERPFSGDLLLVKLGRQDANVDFAVLDGSSAFIHSSLGLPPTIPMPTFPDPGIGAAFFVAAAEILTLGFGLYEGSPNGGRLGLSRLLDGGVFLITQATLHVGSTSVPPDGLLGNEQGGNSRPLPGGYHVGTWYHSPDAAEIGATTGATFSGNYGVFLGAEQQIWSFDPSCEHGVSVVSQYGWAPGDRNHVEHYLGAGIVVRGPFAARSDDSLGVGLAHARFSGHLPTLHDETAIEIYYRFQATKYLALQPDLQFIAHPGGDQKDAMVVGLRFEGSY